MAGPSASETGAQTAASRFPIDLMDEMKLVN